jgi:hypothetical protein
MIPVNANIISINLLIVEYIALFNLNYAPKILAKGFKTSFQRDIAVSERTNAKTH